MTSTLEIRALMDKGLETQVGYSVAIGVIAWLLVFLRLQSKRLIRSTGLDDMFILLAVAVYTVFLTSAILTKYIAQGSMTQTTINEMFKWNTVAGSTYIFTCILTKLSIGFYLRRILPTTATGRRRLLVSVMVTVTLVNLLHFGYRLTFCRAPTAPQSAQLNSRGLYNVLQTRNNVVSHYTTDPPPPIGSIIDANLNDPNPPVNPPILIVGTNNSTYTPTNLTNTRRSAGPHPEEKSLGSQVADAEKSLSSHVASAESTVQNTGIDIDVASDIKNPHAEGFCAVQDAPHLAMVLIAALVNVFADIAFLLLPLKEMLRALRQRRWHKLVFVVIVVAMAGVIVSIVRLPFLKGYLVSNWRGGELLTGMAMVEPGASIICGSVATLRPLGEKWFPRLATGPSDAYHDLEGKNMATERLHGSSHH